MCGRQAGTINEPNDNTINYKNSPQFICVFRSLYLCVCEQLPPPASYPTVLSHCAAQPPLQLSLIMFDCCHCSRTFHTVRRRTCSQAGRQAASRSKSAAAPADPKAAALESYPEPNPNQTKTKPNQRIWHCLSCSCCLYPLCLSVCLFGCVLFLLFFFWASLFFKLYAFKKRLRINWIISFFYYLFFARNS